MVSNSLEVWVDPARLTLPWAGGECGGAPEGGSLGSQQTLDGLHQHTGSYLGGQFAVHMQDTI